MNILHASTDPTLLARLKEMLASSARADIAARYFFMSGFEQVADDLAELEKVRILVCRADRRVLEQVALGLPQARLDVDDLLPRRDRAGIAWHAVDTDALNGMVYDLWGLPVSDIALIDDWFERRSLGNWHS